MKNNIIIDGFAIGTVKRVGHDFGFARTSEGLEVYFNAKHGFEILAGQNHPEFTQEPAGAPRVGEDIIMFLSKGPDGYWSHAWGLRKEYSRAMGQIRHRTAPKPAPVYPPVGDGFRSLEDMISGQRAVA